MTILCTSCPPDFVRAALYHVLNQKGLPAGDGKRFFCESCKVNFEKHVDLGPIGFQMVKLEDVELARRQRVREPAPICQCARCGEVVFHVCRPL
jgi:hypothetical protein